MTPEVDEPIAAITNRRSLARATSGRICPHGGEMPDTLSAVEQKVYHYLLDFLTEHTYQPSVREIGKRFHIKSTKTVSELLQSLERQGIHRARSVALARRSAHRIRGCTPHAARSVLRTHRRGRADAPPRARQGLHHRRPPIHSVRGRLLAAHHGRQHDRPRHLRRRLRDDPARPRQVSEGMIIAARLGEEATVKSYTHRDGKVVLVPANPAEQEIVVDDGDDFAIIGKVCGVFRPFQEVHQHEELSLAE